MRSSKSRSRSKSNRQRSPIGNVVNRVFDSSGPESKVRGTPQQIIDKYLTLARDAQLSNDRVAAENFLQHAEHYARMLGEAQRELDSQRQSQGGGQDGDERGQNGNQSGNSGQNGNQNGGQNGDRSEDRREDRRDDRREDRRDTRRDDRRDDRRPRPSDEAGDVIDLGAENDAGLVETPESGASPRPAPREKTERETAEREKADDSAPQSAAVAEENAPAPEDKPRTRRPRRPRRDSADKGEGPDGDQPSSEAAE
jgi:hypothetical protein